MPRKQLPETGTDWTSLKAEMTTMREGDVSWRDGSTGMYVFFAGQDVLDVAHEAYTMFMSENELGAIAFPSLATMENDVLDFGLSLMNAPDGAAGNMTSGSTDSITMAALTCREFNRSKDKEVFEGKILLPATAHPAFEKAARMLSLKTVRVPVTSDFYADAAAMEVAITDKIIMIVGSAPCFPYGLMYPISALSDVAQRHNIWLHVNACVGGYFAPFARMNGLDIASFGFENDGVQSISADLHKYGYAAKGASSVFYRSEELQSHQYFHFENWASGGMTTPTLAGTRPGGAIAAAWAVMNYLGVEGYKEKAKIVCDTRTKLEEGAKACGLSTHGTPQLGLIAFGTPEISMKSVWGQMLKKGWLTAGVFDPEGLHLMLTSAHAPVIDDYIADLHDAVKIVRDRNDAATADAKGPSYN
jgi:sphinganine-1-phosphate aldolase